MKNAICKFCGSVSTETLPDSATEEELLLAGTECCRCAAAEKFREILKNVQAAKLELDDLCNGEDQELKKINGRVIDIIGRAIDLMPDGEIVKIQVVSSGGTVEVKINAGGKISLARSKTIKRKREI